MTQQICTCEHLSPPSNLQCSPASKPYIYQNPYVSRYSSTEPHSPRVGFTRYHIPQTPLLWLSLVLPQALLLPTAPVPSSPIPLQPLASRPKNPAHPSQLPLFLLATPRNPLHTSLIHKILTKLNLPIAGLWFQLHNRRHYHRYRDRY